MTGKSRNAACIARVNQALLCCGGRRLFSLGNRVKIAGKNSASCTGLLLPKTVLACWKRGETSQKQRTWNCLAAKRSAVRARYPPLLCFSAISNEIPSGRSGSAAAKLCNYTVSTLADTGGPIDAEFFQADSRLSSPRRFLKPSENVAANLAS